MQRQTAGTREAREKENAEKKAKKEAARLEREKAEKLKTRSWQTLLGGAAVVTVIMSIWALLTISRATIQTVQLDDEAKLKEVFFSGEPWLLQCSNENATITEAFVGAARRLSVSAAINVGAIDCAGKLPSNRTFFQRFKLPPVNFTKNPTGYLFANTDSPQQIPEKWMKDGAKLAEWAEKYSKPALKEVAWEKTFAKYCLMRDHCVMVHTKGKYKPPKWLPVVMAKHRSTRFVSINRNLHKTSFDDKVKAPKKDDVPRLAILSRKKGEKEGEDSYSLTLHRGEWTEPAVTALLNSMLVKGEAHKDTTVLEDTPWFDVPPKGTSKKGQKARDQNKEYREQRRRERARRAAEEGSAEEPSSRQRKTEEEQEEEEREAVRRAEEQLEDDDDVVVSDIEDDDDDDDGRV